MGAEIPKNIRATLYIDGKPAEASMKNLETVTRRLQRELKELGTGTEAWNKKMKEVQDHRRALQNLNAEINETNGLFGFLKTEVGKFGALAAGYLGFQFITDQFRNIIMTNAELSDSLADVRKTTGLSEAGVRGLNNELKKLDTRTSRKELLSLAEVAGKLGISGEKDVLGFVKAANQINVALGKDLGNAEQAINDLGKITDLFKIKDQFGIEQALLKTGSAINALGAAGTANEGYIVEFSKRLGTIAPAANISIENVIGLAATMDELGQPAEAATTALGQFIVGMGKDLPTFAKVAGLSVKEFARLLQEDGNKALITVLEKLKSTGGGVQELAAKMGMIGEDGARATAALGALSNNLDKLREKQALSNKEFAKGTSITQEYITKEQVFAGTLERISKWFNSIATSGVVSGALEVMANGFAKLVGITRTYSEKLEEERIGLNKLEFQITSTNTKEEDRIRLINELKAKYPGLLANLDAEKASNLEVAKAIKAVNDQLVNKIVLAKKDEAIEEENKKNAELKMRLLETEDKIREKLVKLREKFPEFKLPEGTDAQKLSALLKQYKDMMDSKGKTVGGVFDPTFGAGKLLRDFAALEAFVKSSTNKTGAMIDKRNELMNRLGISDTPAPGENTETKDPSETVITLPGPTKEELSQAESDAKKALAEFERLNADYKKLGLQRLNDKLSQNEKEVAQEGQKFDELIEKEKAFLKMKGITPGQRDQTNSNISSLEADKEKAIADLRVRQEAEMVEKIRDLRISLANVHESELQKEKASINKFYDSLEKDYAGNENVLAQLRADRISDLSSSELREKERLEKAKAAIEAQYETINGNKGENKLAKINKRYDDEIEALKVKFSKELQLTKSFQEAVAAINKNRQTEIDNETKISAEEVKNFQIEMAQLASDTAFTLMANNRNADTDAAISSIEKQRASELSNKELTEADKQRINERYDQKVRAEKQKAWKAERTAAIAQAVINGALAVTKVLAQTGILSPFSVPAIVAGTLAQVAIIAAQKPPQFAQGGFSSSDPAGYVNKETIFARSATGRPFIAGEAGREWIAPNWMLQNPRTANIIGMLETARQEKRAFALGGYNGDSSQSSGSVYDFGRLESMVYNLVEVVKIVDNKKVILSHSYLEEEQARRVEIVNGAGG